MEIQIDNRLYKEIAEYCVANDIDIIKFIEKSIKRGYAIEKYGSAPSISQKIEEIPVPEVIPTPEVIPEIKVKAKGRTKKTEIIVVEEPAPIEEINTKPKELDIYGE